MNLLLALVYGAFSAPVGTVVTSLSATAQGATPGAAPLTATGGPTDTTVTFTSVPADSYSYSVQALDQNGAAVGPPVTGTFTVSTDTVSVQIPVSATASQT